MADTTKNLVKQQFGDKGNAYVTSKGHAQGKSLERLIDLASPQPEWRVLDVATGGGHNALAFAAHVGSLIASDLTLPMLAAAREFIRTKSAVPVDFVQSDSERMPFASRSFDCVTCRIAAHHFPSIDAFVEECHRVLVPGGIFAMADNVVSGEVKVAKYVNSFETLRDPSHHWAYSVDDWRAALYSVGFQDQHVETFDKDIEFVDWAKRMGVKGDDLLRLKSMLLRAPKPVMEWLRPRNAGGRLVFTLTEMVLIGRKP